MSEPCYCGDPYCRRCFPAGTDLDDSADFEDEEEDEEWEDDDDEDGDDGDGDDVGDGFGEADQPEQLT